MCRTLATAEFGSLPHKQSRETMPSICLRPLLLLALTLLGAECQSNNYPSNDYQYSLSRDLLIDSERNFENRRNNFTVEEQVVDQFLQYLKWREFQATKESGFPPSRPIEEKLDYIQTTEIYKALVKFPKGGNMHSHENHDTSKRVLLDIIWDLPDFDHLFMLPPEHPQNPWKLDFFVNPPNDDPAWIVVKDSIYSKDEILRHQTLLGILSSNASRYPTDSGMRWKEMNVLWGRGSTQLIANINVKRKYLEAIYEIGYRQNLIYFETRKNLGEAEAIYELDTTGDNAATNGKRFLDSAGDLDVLIAQEASRNFALTHPSFVGHNRISYTSRRNSLAEFNAEMQNVVRLHRTYPDHVIGFDAVGEEDSGYSHLHYIDEFLKLYDGATGQSTVPLYLHTAETNWPDDLLSASLDDDLVATLANSYETLLLNSKRIGHGYGFIKHPYLLNSLRERDIAMEVCVVSNQLLGFTPDIRNHPAIHNLRYGIPIVLGSDDAGTFGYDNLTVDWYEAFMAWGLDLNDLRTLALNSFKYSGLSEANKTAAVETKWTPLWENFIFETFLEGCHRDYGGQALLENRTVTFAGLLPKEGAIAGSTKVHVFGRNFERGICKTVVCRFGVLESPAAVYVSNQHLICQSPDFGDQQLRTVAVFVSLNTGDTFFDTGLNFTYLHNPVTVPIAKP